MHSSAAEGSCPGAWVVLAVCTLHIGSADDAAIDRLGQVWRSVESVAGLPVSADGVGRGHC